MGTGFILWAVRDLVALEHSQSNLDEARGWRRGMYRFGRIFEGFFGNLKCFDALPFTHGSLLVN